MATRDPALKLSYDDLALWPDDGKRHLLPGLSIPLTEIFPPFPS
ncbi:MAG TPA: hypothetical protein VJA16_01510 [Thermoanaerobaculia bacterium]